MSAVDPTASTLPPPVSRPSKPSGPLPLKQCMCGAVYTPGEWPSLKNPRLWRLESEWLELRDCPCGSTLATEVPSRTTGECWDGEP